MLLTPNFSFEELTATDWGAFRAMNAAEAESHVDSLRRVAAELLEPIRAAFDAPVRIHSGYRCPELNRAVGGSPTSQHQAGQAADFDVVGWEDRRREALDRIAALPGFKFHQLLIEPGCLHVGLYRPGAPNGEVAFWSAGSKSIITQATA